MLSFILQAFVGVLVGLYSYLSPGIINLQVFQLSLLHRWKKVLGVIAIIALVEIPYCMLCMTGFKWLLSIRYLKEILSWGVFIMLLAMACWMFYKSRVSSSKKENEEISLMSIPALLLFVVLNPFQLSAWSIWGAYFADKTWFKWTYNGIFIFSLGACLGSFIILYIYGHVGKKWMTWFTQNKKGVDIGIAMLLFGLAVFQLYKNIV